MKILPRSIVGLLATVLYCGSNQLVTAETGQLSDQIDKQVTISGKWSNRGKSGPYVRTLKYKDAPIYIDLNPKNDLKSSLRQLSGLYKEFKEGETVKLTGTLHKTKGSVSPNNASQGVPEHFYFYLDEVQIQHLNNEH
jgi:hypothetical protein